MHHIRSSLSIWIAFALLCLIGDAQRSGHAQTSIETIQPRVVVFVCEHGSARSLIAATLFNKVAAERKMSVRATARGLTPDDKVPERVVLALGAEGFDVSGFEPARASDAELSAAARVVGMGIDRSTLRVTSADIETWNEMPSPTDYAVFRRALLDRIDELMRSLRSQPEADSSPVRVEE